MRWWVVVAGRRLEGLRQELRGELVRIYSGCGS